MKVRCPYCGKDALFIEGFRINPMPPHRKQNFYYCVRCGAWVRCFKGSLLPTGTLARRDLREERRLAARVIKRLIKGSLLPPTTARARVLIDIFNNNRLTNIWMLDERQCRVVIANGLRRLERKRLTTRSVVPVGVE
jgi:DNA-directed RNA polymerase subunit RPC12/RpoP